MTTFLSEQSNPRLPAPSAYTRYLERVAAEHEAFLRKRRRDRMMVRMTWASVAFLVGVIVITVLT